MKKKVLVRAPVLTRSGYGEHSRFVLRALRQHEDKLDIYLYPVAWGQCGWIYEDNEERLWLDSIITKTADYQNQTQGNPQFDMSIQVTIPNEWQPLAPTNIGVTAGIETTKVAPVWLERANMMDRIITISSHSKNVFLGTSYEGHNKETGQQMTLKCNKEISVVHYPVKKFEDTNLNLKLKTDFNFLTVAQWGPRKNLENTIVWFIEEFIDNPKVGLIVKTFARSNSIMDRYNVEKRVSSLLEKYKNRKCKVYLLHGDMTDQEIHSLYKHPDIKALISLAHGEGFGLPHFEAAYSGLPILAPEWSGYLDFLCAPKKDKKTGKEKIKPHFACIDYDLQPVQKEAHWEGVVEADALWCFPQQGSYKMKLREVYKDHGRFKSQAKKLQKWILENFSEEDQYSSFIESAFDKEFLKEFNYKKINTDEIPKISLITSVFKADDYIEQLMEDITRQTIFEDKCEWIILNANEKGHDYEEKVILKYAEKYPNNIVYKRLEKDPGVYDTWNMAIEMSTGEYITNVNCDDRRRPDGLEEQAKLLTYNSDIDLVYNDSYIAREPNMKWEDISLGTSRYNFDQFSKEAMLRGNLPHNNPMWRKSLHQKNGFFNQKYRSAADWDLWLRCAFNGAKFMKHPEILGVYYLNPTGISTNPEHDSWKREEEKEIWMAYRKKLQQEKEDESTPESIIL